jgi:probable rRNA maturation factor
MLGELVICAAVLKRQAKEEGHTLLEESAILVVHGLLHLAGLDHEKSAKDAKAMLQAEKEILKRLQVPTKSLIARVK